MNKLIPSWILFKQDRLEGEHDGHLRKLLSMAIDDLAETGEALATRQRQLQDHLNMCDQFSIKVRDLKCGIEERDAEIQRLSEVIAIANRTVEQLNAAMEEAKKPKPGFFVRAYGSVVSYLTELICNVANDDYPPGAKFEVAKGNKAMPNAAHVDLLERIEGNNDQAPATTKVTGNTGLFELIMATPYPSSNVKSRLIKILHGASIYTFDHIAELEKIDIKALHGTGAKSLELFGLMLRHHGVKTMHGLETLGEKAVTK